MTSRDSHANLTRLAAGVTTALERLVDAIAELPALEGDETNQALEAAVQRAERADQGAVAAILAAGEVREEANQLQRDVVLLEAALDRTQAALEAAETDLGELRDRYVSLLDMLTETEGDRDRLRDALGKAQTSKANNLVEPGPALRAALDNEQPPATPITGELIAAGVLPTAIEEIDYRWGGEWQLVDDDEEPDPAVTSEAPAVGPSYTVVMDFPHDGWPLGSIPRKGPGLNQGPGPWVRPLMYPPGHDMEPIVVGTAPMVTRQEPDGKLLRVQLDRAHRSGGEIEGPVVAASSNMELLGQFSPSSTVRLDLETAILGEDNWPAVVPRYLRLGAVWSWSGRADDVPGMPEWWRPDDRPAVSAAIRVVVWNDDGADEPRLGLHVLHAPGAGEDPAFTAMDYEGRELWRFPASPLGRATEVHSRTYREPARAGRSYDRWMIDPEHRFCPDRWHHIALDVVHNSPGEPTGAATLLLDGVPIIHLDGIRLVDEARGHDLRGEGWNFAGVSAQIGGTDPDLIPDTPRAGIQVGYRMVSASRPT